MGPGCFQRDTRKYGLRELPLCTACAVALQGETYKRELASGAAWALAAAQPYILRDARARKRESGA